MSDSPVSVPREPAKTRDKQKDQSVKQYIEHLALDRLASCVSLTSRIVVGGNLNAIFLSNMRSPNPMSRFVDDRDQGSSDTTMATYALRRVAQLPAHDDRAWHVAWNPSSPLLATCSADKTVRVYHYRRKESGEIEFTLIREVPTGHTKTVRAVAWSPSGETLATASFDSTIGVWEQDRGEWECVSTLEGHENECKGVGYSCTGTLLATCSRDKTVWIWEGER